MCSFLRSLAGCESIGFLAVKPLCVARFAWAVVHLLDLLILLIACVLT
jgi:hypothetical protein